VGRVSQLSIVVAHLFTHAGRGFILSRYYSHTGRRVNVYRVEMSKLVLRVKMIN
jgi:hypothetical protein